jgi:hypothetical protein
MKINQNACGNLSTIAHILIIFQNKKLNHMILFTFNIQKEKDLLHLLLLTKNIILKNKNKNQVKDQAINVFGN